MTQHNLLIDLFLIVTAAATGGYLLVATNIPLVPIGLSTLFSTTLIAIGLTLTGLAGAVASSRKKQTIKLKRRN